MLDAFLAIATETTKFKPVLCNLESRLLCKLRIQSCFNRFIQIKDPSAFLTYKVIVIILFDLVSSNHSIHIQFNYRPFIH